MKTVQDDIRTVKELEPTRIVCGCGHTLHIAAYQKEKLCQWCGNVVKNNTLARFKYKYYQEREKLNVRSNLNFVVNN